MKEILTEDEIEKIIKIPNTRYLTGLRNKAILSLIWDTGAKVSDIIELEAKDIDFEQRKVAFEDRVLDFSKKTERLLRKWDTKRPISKYFFCAKNGEKLSRIYLFLMVKRYAKKAGIEKNVSLKTLRNSFAFNHYKKFKDLKTLQKILGHKNIKSTEIYCILYQKEFLEGYEAKNGIVPIGIEDFKNC